MSHADQEIEGYVREKSRRAVGWAPQVGLREGFARTIAFYRLHMHHYVDEPMPATEEARP